MVAPPDDVDALRAALEQLHARFLDGGLPAVELPSSLQARLSRASRVEETAQLLREIVVA